MREVAGEFLDELQGVLLALVGEVQIDHGRGDLAVAEDLLHGVQTRPGLDEVVGDVGDQICGLGEVEILLLH